MHDPSHNFQETGNETVATGAENKRKWRR